MTGIHGVLEVGSGLDCIVDCTRLLGRVNHRLNGLAIHSLCGQDDYPFHRTELVYNLPMSVQRDVLDLRVPASRVFDAYRDEWRFGDFDKVMDGYDICLSLWGWHRSPFVCCLGSAEGDVGYTVAEASDRLLRLVRRGYRLFELENEPYNRRSDGSSRFTYDLAGESAYVDYLRDVYLRVKSVHPAATVLISVAGSQVDGDAPYFSEDMLHRAAGYYDAVAVHHYLSGSVLGGQVRSAYQNMSFEDWVLGENLRCIGHLEQLHRAAQGLPLYVTEWGMRAIGGSESSPKDGNIWAVLTSAYHLLLLHMTGLAVQATAWCLFDAWWPGRTDTGKHLYLRPDQPGRRGFLYWLWYYFVRYCGDYYLDVGGMAPEATVTDSLGTERSALLTPLMATFSWDYRNVYVIALNASWANSYSAVIRFRGFSLQLASGVVMQHSDEDALGIVEGSPRDVLVHDLTPVLYHDRIQFVMQPHSVYFIRVQGAPVQV